MSDAHTLTLAQAKKALHASTLTLGELYQDTAEQVTALNPELNIYLNVHDSAASALAENKKQEIDATELLAGVPVAVKDNYCTTEFPTTASAKILESFMAPFDASVITKLRKKGGCVWGKSNLDAWAHGSSTETSQFGRTLNPRNPEHLPGGSSGGSAAAVAADMCTVALGSETAGSIRQPASWCGVVGLKPSYGRCGRFGTVAMASSTDSPGPLAKTVEDAAITLNAIAGPDPRDGTTYPEPPPDFTKTLGTSIKSLKIGLLYHDIEALHDSYQHIETAAKVLEKLGAKIEHADALDPEYAVTSYTIFQRGEVSSNLARFSEVRYGRDRGTLGEEAKRRIMLGTHTLSKGYADKYYTQASKIRTLYRNDFDKLYDRYDVLISLTSPGFAKKVGATEGSVMFGELEDMLLEPTSITGLPGISVPCYHDPKTNLFLGMNICTPMWREDLMIQVADAYERHTEWNTWRNREDQS